MSRCQLVEPMTTVSRGSWAGRLVSWACSWQNGRSPRVNSGPAPNGCHCQPMLRVGESENYIHRVRSGDWGNWWCEERLNVSQQRQRREQPATDVISNHMCAQRLVYSGLSEYRRFMLDVKVWKTCGVALAMGDAKVVQPDHGCTAGENTLVSLDNTVQRGTIWYRAGSWHYPTTVYHAPRVPSRRSARLTGKQISAPTGGVSYTVGGATVPPTLKFAPPTLCFASCHTNFCEI